MTKKPLILVAGGETLYIDLMELLPRAVCQITYCDTLGQVLDRAADADIVVVDSDMPGGAPELCRRLRDEATTKHVPIILRAPTTTGHENADEVVGIGDLDTLVQAIRKKMPTNARPETSDEEFFDVESSTQVWRRESDEAEGWPPHPPSLEGRDVLAFTRDYAGYVNSLLEAFAAPQTLSLAERQRLKLRSEQVVEGMEGVLDLTQRAVNDSLRQKQLTRMREISAARNVLYEKLRELRAAMDSPVVGSEKPVASAVSVKTSRVAVVDEQPEETPVQESEITRAAREKEAQRKREAASRRAQIRRRRVTGSAKRVGGAPKRSILLWFVLLCIAGGIAAVVMMRPHISKQATGPQSNRPPYMSQVVLQQTPEAVHLMQLGTDPDGDQLTFTIDWKVNGRSVTSNTKRLAARFYSEGDTVEADVTPNDGKTSGPPMISQPLRIISP